MEKRQRTIRVFDVDSPELLATALSFRRPYFTLFLAWDAPLIEKPELVSLFRPLVDRGLAYFCAWGNHCEEVHDAVDTPAAERESLNSPLNYVTMTTWHAKDTLVKAAWFFKVLAIPSEPHVAKDFDRFAISINNRKWSACMRKYLTPPIRLRPPSIPMKPLSPLQ